jgi:hypothetical protein
VHTYAHLCIRYFVIGTKLVNLIVLESLDFKRVGIYFQRTNGVLLEDRRGAGPRLYTFDIIQF